MIKSFAMCFQIEVKYVLSYCVLLENIVENLKQFLSKMFEGFCGSCIWKVLKKDLFYYQSDRIFERFRSMEAERSLSHLGSTKVFRRNAPHFTKPTVVAKSAIANFFIIITFVLSFSSARKQIKGLYKDNGWEKLYHSNGFRCIFRSHNLHMEYLF